MAKKETTVIQLDGEINLKADKAKQSMQELKNLLNEFKNKTIDVKAQTRSARMSIQNLGDFISRTFNRENTVKLATADAQAKVDRLAITLKSFKDNTKITLSLDARGVSSQLQSIRNDLNFITGKHTISINASTQQVKSQLTSLAKDINNIKNVRFTVNVKNNADLKGINTFTKDMSKLAGLKSDITFGITVKSVQNSLDRVRQVSNVLANLKNNNSIQFTESGLNPILGKLKNMELYLRSIKQNSKIKIEATGAKELPKLKVNADQSDLFAVEKRLAIIRAMIRQINRMTLKINTRYNNRSGGGGSRGGNGGGSRDDDRWFGNWSTYLTHFLGRSSKGWGSFGEAIADLAAKLQSVGGVVGNFGTALAGGSAVIASMAAAGQIAVSALSTFASIMHTIFNALRPGLELMHQRDTTLLTTRAGLMASSTVDGRKPTQEEADAESMFLFNRAVKQAASTVLNLNDILTAQQGVLPMLLNKGMTPKQAQDVIFGVAGVAKTGRLAPNQVLQETRDLAQGSITARTSQVANILGITNQDLAKFKGNVDELYSYLMQKFQEYNKVMEEYANTPAGAIEQLQETWGIAAMTIVDQYGPLIVEIAHEITDALGKFDENGNFELSDWLQELADGLKEVIRYTISCAEYIVTMAMAITGTNDPVEALINILEDLVGAATHIINVIGGVIIILKAVWVAFRSVFNIIGAGGNVVLSLTQALLALSAAWAGNVDNAKAYKEAAQKSLEQAITDVKSAVDFEGAWKGTLKGDTADFMNFGDGKNSTFAGTYGKWTKKFDELMAKADSRVNKPAKDVGGMRGTAQNKEDEKARKKAIKDAQKAMKEHIQGLKEQLKDHIAELKETLAKNKIAFDEGFMAVKDFYTQKAQLETEEARLRLEEAQAEKAAILATPYENQADQLKALHSIEREIRQQTRAYNKGLQAQKEVVKATERSSKAMELITNLFSGHDAVQTTPVVNQQQQQTAISASNNQKAIESFANDVAVKNMGYVANEIINQAIAKLGNNERGWTLAKFANAIAAAESHYNQGVTSSAGAIGIMQLMPDTASSLGVNPWDWKQNIAGGIKYLYQQLETFGWDLKKAAAAYNAGPGAVKDYGGVPPYRETQGYVSRVSDYVRMMDSNGFNASIVSNEKAVDSIASGVIDSIGNDLLFKAYDTITKMVNAGILNSAGDAARYKYGGNSIDEGFDCSGFVKFLLSSYIKGFARTADAQYEQFKNNNAISKDISKMMPGDLMFFADNSGVHHVSMFTGVNSNGEHNMVHARTTKKGIRYDTLEGSGGYYMDQFAGFGSVRKMMGVADIGQMAGQSVQTQAQKSVTQVASMVSNEVYGKLVDELLIGKSMEVIDALKKAAANVTETGSEADKALLNQVSDLVNLRAELDGRITGNQRSGVMKILMEFYKNLINAKQDENLIRAYTDKMMTDIRDQRRKVITDMFNFTLADIEYKGNIVGNEILTGILNSEEKIADYFKKIFDVDPGNIFNPGNYYKQLEALYREYEEKGELMAAVEIRNLLDEALKKVQSVIKGWIDKGLEYLDKQQAIFEADSSFTNLQREFGNREFQAYKAEYEYGMRAKLADRLQDRFNNRNDEMKILQSRLDDINTITTELHEKAVAMNSLEQDTTKVVAEQSKYKKEQSDIESRLQLLRGQKSDIEREKMLNDLELQRLKLLKEQPKYLTDLRNTAKQALEDGLVTFLTDGINEAESLGEALRNLAITFLKEIQKMSAQWMVKSLMNKWFGQFKVISPEEVSASNSSASLNELRRQTALQSEIVSLLSGKPNISTGKGILSIDSSDFNFSGRNISSDTLLNNFDESAISLNGVNEINSGLDNFSNNFKSNVDSFTYSLDGTSSVIRDNTLSINGLVSATKNSASITAGNASNVNSNTVAINSAKSSQDLLKSSTDINTKAVDSNTNSKSITSNSNVSNLSGVSNISNVGMNNPISGIVGSGFGQLAGSAFAGYSLFSGDAKERLLSTIFFETQLIYQGQMQSNFLLSSIYTALQTLSSMGGYGYMGSAGSSYTGQYVGTSFGTVGNMTMTAPMSAVSGDPVPVVASNTDMNINAFSAQNAAGISTFQNNMLTMLPQQFNFLGSILNTIFNGIIKLTSVVGSLFVVYVAIKAVEYILSLLIDAVVEVGKSLIEAIVTVAKEILKFFALLLTVMVDWGTSPAGLARAMFGNKDETLDQKDAITLLTAILDILTAMFSIVAEAISYLTKGAVEFNGALPSNSDNLSEENPELSEAIDGGTDHTQEILDFNESLTNAVMKREAMALIKKLSDNVDALVNSIIYGAAAQVIAAIGAAFVLAGTISNAISSGVVTISSYLYAILSICSAILAKIGSKGGGIDLKGVGNFLSPGDETKVATGGYISGPGTSTSDSIPAMLSNGEYVVKASSVRKYGTNFLNAVNSGSFTKIKSGVQHFAEGGLVENVARSEINEGMQGFANQQRNNQPINNTAHINVALVRDEAEGFRQLLKSPEGQRIMLDFSRKYASVTSRF